MAKKAAKKKTKSEVQVEQNEQPAAEVTTSPAESTISVGLTEEEVEQIDAAALQHADSLAELKEAEPPLAEEHPDVEQAVEDLKPNSVVSAKYKNIYLENARAAGNKGKAPKRSNWDWLAQELAHHCLSAKGSISIPDFLAILDANEVDYSKWTNRNKGWEGRLRMTGRVALQKKVANSAALRFPDGTVAVPPAEFVERYKDKAKSEAA